MKNQRVWWLQQELLEIQSSDEIMKEKLFGMKYHIRLFLCLLHKKMRIPYWENFGGLVQESCNSTAYAL